MAQETSKATSRRFNEDPDKWEDIFHGDILDVGPGDDPLVWQNTKITPFDKEQGDANNLLDYFQPNSFDCVHGSQVMEHVYDPSKFMRHCLQIVKPGGWVVMTIPDFDLYEKRHFPSKYNPDHKTTWSLWRNNRANAQPNSPHMHVPTWIKQFDVAQKFATLIDTNYDYLAPDTKDQTWLRKDEVECFIEILLKKHD